MSGHRQMANDSDADDFDDDDGYGPRCMASKAKSKAAPSALRCYHAECN